MTPDTSTAGILRRPYLLATVGTCALVFLSAFESLAVTTVMPVVSRDLNGAGLYALAFAGPLDQIPENWRLCNGDTVAQSTYSSLWQAIGTTWGGSGATAFKLPDLRGVLVEEQHVVGVSVTAA